MSSEPTRLQRFVLGVMPDRWARAAETESKEWHLICTRCGQSVSWWESGGIRFKARSKGKRMRRRCRACGERSWHRVERLR